MTTEEAFRAQNSINLSIALVAAAFALMAGVVAAFFAVADKVPPGAAGVLIVGVTVMAVALCLASVFFGGRGVSKTLRSIKAAPGTLADAYDGGNFSLQGVTGTLGTIAVVVMIGLSIKVRSHSSEPEDGTDSWRTRSAALSEELSKVNAQSAELSARIDQIARVQDTLAAHVGALESSVPEKRHARAKSRSKASE